MKQYRKKPIVLNVMRFTDTEADTIIALQEFTGSTLGVSFEDPENPRLRIVTLEGDMFASLGDYICQGIAGEFYPIKPEIFEQIYEEI